MIQQQVNIEILWVYKLYFYSIMLKKYFRVGISKETTIYILESNIAFKLLQTQETAMSILYATTN